MKQINLYKVSFRTHNSRRRGIIQVDVIVCEVTAEEANKVALVDLEKFFESDGFIVETTHELSGVEID